MSACCRRLAAEYVAKHLHGMTVLGSLPEVTSAAKLAPLIVTHNGSFHCDEAMACGLLRHSADYTQATILRSRDPALIAQGTIVVDVGAEYDAAKLRFDHHQSSFHETMKTTRRQYTTRLSSAGLIYRHYGRAILDAFVCDALASSARATILQMTGWPEDRKALTPDELDVLYDVIYASFIEEVDGVDNGVLPMGLVPSAEGAGKDTAGATLVHHYKQTTSLSARVGQLQVWWNEPPLPSADHATAAAREDGESAAFATAVELCSTEFFQAVSYYAFAWLPARGLVERAFHAAHTIHPSGKIVALRERFCPWKDHLLQLEEEEDCVGRVLYVIYGDGKGWRVQAVPKDANASFENRKPLPYKGLRDAELSAACGIDGGVFVHVSGFIGGMKTYEGAVQLAIKALTVE